MRNWKKEKEEGCLHSFTHTHKAHPKQTPRTSLYGNAQHTSRVL